MRIIAGDFKGRKLTAPLDRKVRPTTDKVKEAIFSIVMPYIEDAIVFDLFAGTGNLGLEALSRGAAHCFFCDAGKDSLSLIKQNIKLCNAELKSTVIPGDFRNALLKINKKADIILLDPPYKSGYLPECLDLIQKIEKLNSGGIIVAEFGDDTQLEDHYGLLCKIKQKQYGTVNIAIYELMCPDALD